MISFLLFQFREWKKKSAKPAKNERFYSYSFVLYQASVFVLFFKVVIFMWVISLDHWGSLGNWGLLKYQKKRRANTRHERHDHPHAMMLLLLENCVVFKNFACFLRKEGFFWAALGHLLESLKTLWQWQKCKLERHTWREACCFWLLDNLENNKCWKRQDKNR